MNDNGLQGRVALITGGARRIGASVARGLHQLGMNLVVHHHASESEAQNLRAELNGERPQSVVLVRGNLANGDSVARQLVSEAIAAFRRLDVLVNNAARFRPTPFGDATEAQWADLVNTNLRAPFFLIQAAAPYLKRTQGCVINLADVYAERPLAEHPIYSLTKAGIVSLTRSAARDLGPEIRVNAIAPGAILWPEVEADEMAHQRVISRTILKRAGGVEDIVSAAIYLVRDAPYVTGQVLAVDGGRSVVV